MQRIPVGDERGVCSFAADTSLAEGNFEVFGDDRSRLCTIVLRFGFEEDRDPTRAHGRAKQTSCIVREAGVNDTCSGEGGQYAIDTLRVVESPLDVASGGESDGDVGRVLPVATPEVVGRVHELLHSRPEVIRELSSLDDDTDLVAEAAHTVCCPDDVVLSNRGVEDTLVAELLQHPLGDVEDTALVLVGDVLSPEEGIGIVAELLLERLVQCLYQSELLARAIGDTSTVLVSRISLADDVLHDGVCRRIWSLEGVAISDLQLFACFGFDGL